MNYLWRNGMYQYIGQTIYRLPICNLNADRHVKPGVSTLQIVTVVAQNGYRNDTPSVYGESDIINITFSEPTNKGFLPDFVPKVTLHTASSMLWWVGCICASVLSVCVVWHR